MFLWRYLQEVNKPCNGDPSDGEPGDGEPKVPGNGMNWDDIAKLGLGWELGFP